MPAQPNLFLITHSHWDREWYNTFEEFRSRLVDVFDRVIEYQAKSKSFAHFHLDGQTILIDDYLEVRPERAEDVRGAIAAGRLSVGPLYIQNDEFLSSAEGFVENALIGAADGRRWGAARSEIMYLPDNFGHITQLPQIANQLGLKYFYAVRGWPAEEIRHSEFQLEGPDGSRVLTVCHPWTYGLARELVGTDEEIAAKLDTVIEKLRTLAHEGAPLLLMNGVDHVFPSDTLDTVMRLLSVRDPGARQTTLDDYFRSLETRLPETIEVKRGECRFVPSLYDVLSSRMPQKIMHEDCRRALEDRLDPLCAIALIAGVPAPLPQRKQAWRLLIQNLPHDSICGCSKDAAHQDIETRFRRSRELSDMLAHELTAKLVGGTTQPPPASPTEGGFVTIFNPLPRERRGAIVEFDLDFLKEADVFHWSLSDADGRTVPVQILGITSAAKRMPSLYNVPRRKNFLRVRVAAEVNLPATGIARFDVAVKCGKDDAYAMLYGAAESSHAVQFVQSDAGAISPRAGVLENEFLTAEIDAHGHWTVTDRVRKRTYVGQNSFESAPDLGNLYYRAQLPGNPRTLSHGALRRTTCLANGPLLATYQLDFELRVPAGLTNDHATLSDTLVDVPISTRVTLRKGSPVLEFETTVDNTAKDHCLRAMFPTGIATSSVTADSVFDVISRPASEERLAWRNPYLQPVTSNRQHHKEFVDVSDGSHGLAVLSCGLPEHELTTGASPSLCLTLLRAVGWIYREALGDTPTPDGQCLGPMTARYALYPHGGDWVSGHAKDRAREFCAGIDARHWFRDAAGDARVSFGKSLVHVPAPLVLSAFKPSHDGRTVVLRVYNPTSAPVSDRISLGMNFKNVFESRLDETRGARMNVSSGALPVSLRPHQIATWEIEL